MLVLFYTHFAITFLHADIQNRLDIQQKSFSVLDQKIPVLDF